MSLYGQYYSNQFSNCPLSTPLGAFFMYYNNMNTKTKALRVFKLTDNQVSMMCESIMFAYEMDVPEQKGWDIQTYDNMVDNVPNGKRTILSNDVKGIMPL